MASSVTPLSPAFVSVLFVIALVALQGAPQRAGAADTLFVNQPLSVNHGPLVSKSGKFALGFFQPGNKDNLYFVKCDLPFFSLHNAANIKYCNFQVTW
jgi:hypothetical protein